MAAFIRIVPRAAAPGRTSPSSSVHRIKFLRVAALAVKAHQLAAQGERGAPVAGLLRFGERGKEYALRAVPVAAAHAVVRSRGYAVHCFFHTAIIP